MVTIDIVNQAWANFEKCTETAEQHEFVRLAMIQFKMEPLLNDLRKNWHVGHAHTFMKAMKIISQKLGFKCPEFEEGENGEV